MAKQVHGEYYKNADGTRWQDEWTKENYRWDGKGNCEWMTASAWEAKYGTTEESVEEIVEPVKRGRGRPRKAEAEKKSVESAAKDAIFDMFVLGAKTQIMDDIQSSVADGVADLRNYLDSLYEQIIEHENKKVTIVGPMGTKELVGTRHMNFNQLLSVVGAGLSAMLVGPAGTGKTYASEQVAEALDMPFYGISVGAQTSKSDLFGFMDGSGTYRSTMFRQAYEHGGVFLMDEIDAGNANVLVMLNSALAGKSAAFPDRQEMVAKHENFRFICTANTFGTGASRQYVGRNQIDAATLDRFVTLDWPIDLVLEAAMVQHSQNGTRWHNVVKSVRKLVDDNSWRVVVSPRATAKGAMLLDAGLDFKQVVEMTLLGTADANQRQQIERAAKGAW